MNEWFASEGEGTITTHSHLRAPPMNNQPDYSPDKPIIEGSDYVSTRNALGGH